MDTLRWPVCGQVTATRSVSRACAVLSFSTGEQTSGLAQQVAEAEKEHLGLLDTDLLPVLAANSSCSRYGPAVKTASVLAGFAILALVVWRGWADYGETNSSLPLELFSSCEESCKRSSDVSMRLLKNKDIKQRPICRPSRRHHGRRAVSKLSAEEKAEELEELLERDMGGDTSSPKGSRGEAKQAVEASDASSDDVETIQHLMQQQEQQEEHKESKGTLEMKQLEQFTKWHPQHKVNLKSETAESAEQKTQQLAVMIAESDARTTTTTTMHCIDVRPVLKLTIGVTVDDSVSALVDMMTPMFLRAYKRSVQQLLNTKEVFTHILADTQKGSRRLPDLEGAIPAKVGKTFNIVAEVTDPSTEVVESIESPDFPDKFRAAVRDEMNKQGAAEGMGSVQGMAEFGQVEVVESNTNEIDGEFESLGFGTVCRRSRHHLSFDAHHHTEVMHTESLRTCSKICNMRAGKCHGFEFRNSESRCELWKVPICYSAAPLEAAKGTNDFECFRKCE
eukprot:TRINITY_DN7680_c0_g1_i2.p1 TRINITY_DN7680_c0_g1~~TRINITY_DN7680_c0_g1_i2.p1  ORF type:complete len:507 (+),score=103.87 TRINITY_DN7680_c0_g1_i2:44-1564(+)